MRRSLFSVLSSILCLASSPALCAGELPRRNVLFIAVDDLNDWVGCLGGHPQVRTPHIDRLAARGTVFTNAHCQAPLCNPSRSSLLTGLRPSTTGIYGLAPGIRDVDSLKNHITLPQTLTSEGYSTFTCGKVYHDGSIRPDARATEFRVWDPSPGTSLPAQKFVHTPTDIAAMDWGIFPEHDEDQADWKIASSAVHALESTPKNRPFFIACGFRLPHVPCFATSRWFDLYPTQGLMLPPVRDDDRDDTPRFSWYLHWRLPEPRLKFLRANDQWGNLVRAYLASISFMDSQVGRVLDALDASGRAGETLVVLWSDHGWHLGEKLVTGKNTLWERSTRVPLIFAGPEIGRGARCGEPVELLDIFPTLLDLCAFPPRPDLEGQSLVPQLRDANAIRTRPAVTTHNRGNHAVRTRNHRYIRYADGSEELYDLRTDPNEWTNRAADPAFAALKRDLARWLPSTNHAPVPGSAHRVLTYDRQTGAITWEGAPVKPNDPIPEIDD
ncbi:MAG: sulfatase [Isosphaeraceae bacterium]|nr:sulfatase [Isosphaeraceae bacterium]